MWKTVCQFRVSALQKVELDRDYVVESMEIDGRTYSQKQARLKPRCAQQELLQTVITAALADCAFVN